MKKLTYTAFVAFWSSVATLLIVAALTPDARLDAQPPPATYTLQDVAQHADAESCWMAIDGSVYDITAYIPMHPTSPDVLLEWCGREATEGMRTKGYGRNHSPTAWGMLDGYSIGVVER